MGMFFFLLSCYYYYCSFSHTRLNIGTSPPSPFDGIFSFRAVMSDPVENLSYFSFFLFYKLATFILFFLLQF